MQFAQKLLSTRSGTIAFSAIAAVLAALIFLIYLHRYRSTVQSESTPATMLVAKDLIEAGTPGAVIGSGGQFQTTSVARSELKEGAITDPDALRGLVASEDIYPGQPLTEAEFQPTSADALENKISADQRAISVPLDSAHGMIGDVHPGDHVDVYGAFNVKRLRPDGTVDPDAAERPVVKLIVEDVGVLKAPDQAGNGFGAGAANQSNVTLRVTDQQAAELAFATENGKVWITLRPTTGAAPTSPDLVTLETVLFGVKPIAATRSFGATP